MKFITGGAYQGKLEYAMKNYSISTAEISDGEEFSVTDLPHIKCINNYHLAIKNLLQNGKNPIESTNEILAENPNIIIIMNEIGNGIIPLEKSERIWREQVGNVGCYLAEKADTVERIVCGVTVKIKG